MTEPNNNCFIITPIGTEGDPERRFADGITNAVLRPVLDKFGMKPVVAHEISTSGSINDQVIEHIYEDKLAICNLTGLNPNVMYELGIRYTMRKHTILICEIGTRLPFDIVAERTIFYTNDIAGSEELKEKLNNMINAIDYSVAPENPVFKVLDFDHAMGNLKEEAASSALLDKLKDILEKHNQPIYKENNNFVVVIEKIDGIDLTVEEWNNLMQQILNISNNQVYFTSSSVSITQKIWIVYYTSLVPVNTAFEMITQAVSMVFGQRANTLQVNKL